MPALTPSSVIVLSWLCFTLVVLAGASMVRDAGENHECLATHRATSQWWTRRNAEVQRKSPPRAYPSPSWERVPWVNHLRQWDRAAFIRLNTDAHNQLTCVAMPAVTVLGEGHIVALLLLLMAVLARRARSLRAQRSAWLGLAAVATNVVVPVIKALLPRARPPGVFIEETTLLVHPLFGGSFPSGHAMTAFSVAVLLALRHPWTTPWVLGLASAIAYSRIAVGVHFPMDVLAGSALGVAAGVVTHLWGRRLERRGEA